MSNPKHNPAVDHPDHYNQHPMECIEVIRVLLTPDEFRGFCIGNGIKYRWRAGSKPGNSADQDMAKAEWYERRARTPVGSIRPTTVKADVPMASEVTLVQTSRCPPEVNVVNATSADTTQRALPHRPTQHGGLSYDEIEAALDRVGYDVQCSACMEAFYSGSTESDHSTDCSTHSVNDHRPLTR